MFAAYFLEAGLILVVAPWSGFWEHNRFVSARSSLQAFAGNPYLRGAVSGIGVITAIAGFAELATALPWRRREQAGPEQAGR